MQFGYSITFEEYVEAMKTVAAKPVKKNAKRAFVGWLVYVALIFAVVVFLNQQTPKVLSTTPDNWQKKSVPTANLWVTLVPSLVPATLLLLIVFVGYADSVRRARYAFTRNASPLELAPSPLLGYLLLLPFAFLVVPNVSRLAIYWTPSPGTMVWVALIPWIGLILLLSLCGRFTRKAALRKGFASARSIRRTTTIAVDEAGVSTNDQRTCCQYQWSSFDRYQESTHLLKLVTENDTMVIIPKRAINDTENFDRLCGLIQTNIARGQFLPRESRFQVLPAAPMKVEPTEP
jgi:YcxB-like protein